MVPPVTEEAEWLTCLSDVPEWTPPGSPTLIISPHPDDETLGAGGLIAALRAQHTPVTVAAVTDGENAYAGLKGLGPIRKVEQTAALKRLGVSLDRIVRFALPDSNVQSYEDDLSDHLRELITSETYVLAPWTGDFHPDHEACGRAATKVVAEKSARLTFYFFWTWHYGTPDILSRLALGRFPLSQDLLRDKAEALACHVTQLQREEGEPILPERLLAPANRSFEVFAEKGSTR